ncbi:MAG: riboflavin biosynthesis protein RibF [Elusimicrobia bacterium GWA2_56_46]|nr:MAG: riboflavin biosynthesis protein RibF [Elusimicrobia bacterium GWA2_56_46]OGR55644.1 MAG: riboflavin biosynthesis protein RibF [Elusimicrobia bacterium GWC2_56_31]HBB66046.1 riboflavin biosynthesis protein RibF [Elusimicrobiota bacterium]HBW22751.1 riboflavin biosynthesis protein RibF [Elusimicrobiota bacterium]
MPVFLTIGTYDGVHLGHQKIIRALIRESLKRGLDSSLAYFPLPPRFFFSGEKENCLITLPGEREERIRRLGVKNIARIPFNNALAEMSAEAFFDKIILNARSARGLCVGRDFALGKDRKGDLVFLRRRCASAGVGFKAIPFAVFKGSKISSSLIRAFLRKGRVEPAARCLGWNYSVSGKVVRGAGLGRRLGFPTANIGAHPAKILPPGIFAVRVRLGDEMFYGVANVGRRPTVAASAAPLLLEVHILDFDRNIYGRRLEVEFLRRLRPERKFSSREALRRQIFKDVKTARQFLQ